LGGDYNCLYGRDKISRLYINVVNSACGIRKEYYLDMENFLIDFTGEVYDW